MQGCPNLTSGGACDRHRVTMQQHDDRASASARGYDARWRRLRAMALRRHPLCADPFGVHQRRHEVELATDVDHVVPLAGGGGSTDDNLQSLCHACHSRKTATQSSGWGGRVNSLPGST